MRLISLVFMLLLGASAWADPPKVKKVEFPDQPVISMDNTYSLKAGDLLMLTGDLGCKWDLTTKMEHKTATFGATIIFNAPADTPDGTEFVLGCMSNNERTLVLIKITNSGVKPPPTPPGPGPVPPDPAPTELVKKFQTLFDADKSISDKLKPKALTLLIALYDQAQHETDDKTNVSSDTVRSVIGSSARGLMQSFMRENGLVVKDDDSVKAILRGIRDQISDEMSTAFPDDVELTDDNRKKLKATYGRVASALKAVKVPTPPAVTQ